MSLKLDITKAIHKEFLAQIKLENKYRSTKIALTEFDIYIRADAAADEVISDVYRAIKNNDDF